MVYQDRNNLISIAVTLLVNAYVIVRLFQMSASGAFDGPDAINLWAQMVIWVIPIAIVANIAGTILFNIGYAIVTGQAKPSFLVDERDKLFDRRGMIAMVLFVMVGFLAAILSLALGASALIGFNIVYFSMALGSITGDVVKFISYRRGY